MVHEGDSSLESNRALSGQAKPFSPEDDGYLREALKRCSASTYEAAFQFRKTKNAEHLSAIVLGIIRSVSMLKV